jgi:hypothetical protein
MKQNDQKSAEAARFLDNLTSFLAENTPSREDLVEDLQASGLDPNLLSNEFRELLSNHAPTWKQKAQRERLAALEVFSKGVAPTPRTRSEIEQLIRSLIRAMQQLGAPVVAGAYHQKFQQATDADLESLLQDLEAQYQILKGKTGNE